MNVTIEIASINHWLKRLSSQVLGEWAQFVQAARMVPAFC